MSSNVIQGQHYLDQFLNPDFVLCLPCLQCLLPKIISEVRLKRTHLLQEDLPGVEPLEVGDRQQGVEDPGDHDDQGKSHPEVVEQLVGGVLLGVRPNVEDKSSVFFTHFESWESICDTICLGECFCVTCNKERAEEEKVRDHL